MLHYACIGQHLSCVQLLLNNDASVHFSDKVLRLILIFLRIFSKIIKKNFTLTAFIAFVAYFLAFVAYIACVASHCWRVFRRAGRHYTTRLSAGKRPSVVCCCSTTRTSTHSTMTTGQPASVSRIVWLTAMWIAPVQRNGCQLTFQNSDKNQSWHFKQTRQLKRFWRYFFQFISKTQFWH